MTFPPWQVVASALIEIAVLFTVMYGILRFLQGTRGAGVLRGLVFFVIITMVLVLFFVDRLRLYRIEYLITGSGILAIMLPLVVLFQPEIRRLLLRLGEAPMLRWFFRGGVSIVPEIVDAVFTLADRRIGGLIAIERETGLGAVIEGGTAVDAAVTGDLLVTIFWPGSPLHDGAVVIRGTRIAAAACIFPLTEQPGIARTLGTRHRAAIGLTEESDAITIVVSEETQRVSVAFRGQLRMGLDRTQLQQLLEEMLVEAVAAIPSESARP